MSAEAIPNHSLTCLGCGKELDIAEIHWYGSTCNECEGKWEEAMDKWRHGERVDYPLRPGKEHKQ